MSRLHGWLLKREKSGNSFVLWSRLFFSPFHYSKCDIIFIQKGAFRTKKRHCIYEEQIFKRACKRIKSSFTIGDSPLSPWNTGHRLLAYGDFKGFRKRNPGTNKASTIGNKRLKKKWRATQLLSINRDVSSKLPLATLAPPWIRGAN